MVPASHFEPPDMGAIHGELRRHRHVTLRLLWEEYRERHGIRAFAVENPTVGMDHSNLLSPLHR